MGHARLTGVKGAIEGPRAVDEMRVELVDGEAVGPVQRVIDRDPGAPEARQQRVRNAEFIETQLK